MSIYYRCPACRFRSPYRKQICRCGINLLNARKSKKGSYWVNFRVGTKQGWKSAGIHLEAAKALDDKYKSLKHEGRLQDYIPKKQRTFVSLAEWFLELPSIRRLVSLKDLRAALNHFLAVFGSLQILKLKAEDLERFQEDKVRVGYAVSYVDKMVGAARNMVKRAIDNDKAPYAALKPFKAVGKMLRKNGNARARVLTPDEYLRLYDLLPDHLKPVFATAYYTGMRKGEILGLTWDRVDLDKRLIRLRDSDTKDFEERFVPVSDELFRELTPLYGIEREGHVFLYKRLPFRDIRVGLQSACEEAGIAYGSKIEGGFVFHDLRHTFNTNMRKAGVAESVIMKITGHSTREMFDRYNTVDHTDISQAVKQLGGFLKDE